jgi:hypothetical protein
MAKGTDCKCGAEMKYIARESDYGDTRALVFWCPKCGRALIVEYGRQPEEPDTEKWYEPGLPDDPKAAINHELACLKQVGGDYEWANDDLILRGNGVVPQSTLKAFASRIKRKVDLTVSIGD